MPSPPDQKKAGVAFFILGLALIAVGASTERALAVAGLAFLVIGVVQMARARR